jgi:molybdopterin converting factor small subunit
MLARSRRTADVGDGRMIMTRILFFGNLKDRAGRSEMTVSLPPSARNHKSVAAFIAGSDESLGAALSARSVRIAVDREIVGADATFDGPEEIAFMPPFSGG